MWKMKKKKKIWQKKLLRKFCDWMPSSMCLVRETAEVIFNGELSRSLMIWMWRDRLILSFVEWNTLIKMCCLQWVWPLCRVAHQYLWSKIFQTALFDIIQENLFLKVWLYCMKSAHLTSDSPELGFHSRSCLTHHLKT